MKRKFRVNPEARIVHIPKEIIDDGMEGDVDGYVDAFTITLVRPQTPLNLVVRSLRLVIKDLELRMQTERVSEVPSEGVE